MVDTAPRALPSEQHVALFDAACPPARGLPRPARRLDCGGPLTEGPCSLATRSSSPSRSTAACSRIATARSFRSSRRRSARPRRAATRRALRWFTSTRATRTARTAATAAIYAEIIRQIRARSPILIQTTNGIGVRRDPATGQFIWPTDSERLGLLDLEPPAGPVRHRRGLGGLPQPGRRLSRGNAVRELARAAEDRRSRRSTRRARRSSTKSSRRARCIGCCVTPTKGCSTDDRDNVWLLHGGGFGATPPIARNVLFAIDEGLRLFPRAIWGVTATGRDMFRIVTLGLSLGCDLVRVGFEDGIHLPDGTRRARQQRDGCAPLRASRRSTASRPRQWTKRARGSGSRRDGWSQRS